MRTLIKVETGHSGCKRLSPLGSVILSMDLRAHQYKVIEGLLASGHDQAISVALVTACGAWPTDAFTRIFTCLAAAIKQPTTQKVTAALLGQFPVMLHPIDPSTKARDPGQPAYTVRFLSQRSDQNADFEDALSALVADMVAQLPRNFPAGAGMWGEPYAASPAPQSPGTQEEFEDLAKAFLMLLSTAHAGRLHGYISNHLAAKQLADERALKMASDTAASALALAKAQEEERVRLAKATPDFPEHLVLAYIARLEEIEGHMVLNPFLNNARVMTKVYDCIRANSLPSSPALAPDQCKPYADALTGQVLFYKTSAKLAQATDGGQSATAVAYEFEEELVEGGASPEKRQRLSSSPLTIDKAFANTQRWFMTLLVATQALPPGATFRLTPRAALAYLQTLHYVSTYQGMTLERFLMYRNESLREIIVSYNKDGAGGSLDPVLKTAIVTLNNDLVNFRKLFASHAPADKATPAPSVCANCDRLKKQCEEAKSENINKAKRITSLDEQLARLKVRLASNGAGIRAGPGRGGSNRGGSHRGGARDFDRDHDRDRDRDHDRGRDIRDRGKRSEPGAGDTKNP